MSLSGFRGNLTLCISYSIAIVIITHGNIGEDTPFVAIKSSKDIDEIRFSGNDVTIRVFLAGKPRMRPSSNAFL